MSTSVRAHKIGMSMYLSLQLKWTAPLQDLFFSVRHVGHFWHYPRMVKIPSIASSAGTLNLLFVHTLPLFGQI